VNLVDHVLDLVGRPLDQVADLGLGLAEPR
jgi:hypothetical protein